MNRAELILFACPAILAPMLLVSNPTHAKEIVVQSSDPVASTSATPVYEIVFEQQTPASPTPQVDAIAGYGCNCSSESPMLEFTDQESDASIERYGCDCAGCLNALRQLQGKLPLL